MEIKTFSDLHEHIHNFKSQEEADDFWYKKKWVALDEMIKTLDEWAIKQKIFDTQGFKDLKKNWR